MDAGDDVVEVGSRSLKERNEQGFAQAIDLSQDDPSDSDGDDTAEDTCTVAFHVRTAAHGAAAGACSRADAVSRGRASSPERACSPTPPHSPRAGGGVSAAGTERVRVFGQHGVAHLGGSGHAEPKFAELQVRIRRLVARCPSARPQARARRSRGRRAAARGGGAAAVALASRRDRSSCCSRRPPPRRRCRRWHRRRRRRPRRCGCGAGARSAADVVVVVGAHVRAPARPGRLPALRRLQHRATKGQGAAKHLERRPHPPPPPRRRRSTAAAAVLRGGGRELPLFEEREVPRSHPNGRMHARRAPRRIWATSCRSRPRHRPRRRPRRAGTRAAAGASAAHRRRRRRRRPRRRGGAGEAPAAPERVWRREDLDEWLRRRSGQSSRSTRRSGAW